MKSPRIWVAAIAVAWVTVVSAAADGPVDLPLPGSDAWRPLEIPGVDKPTSYETREENGRVVLRADSQCGASSMAVPIAELDAERTPLLVWDWRIEKGLAIPNERTKGGDDFAARVIVMFEFDASQATMSERLLHTIAETVRGEPVPGRSLAYVWSSRQAPGEAWENPFRTPTVLISLGRGVSSDWHSVRVDLRRDYRRYWKAEPPPVVGIAVLTDADNTCGHAVASYADFRFEEAGVPTLE